MDDDPARLIRMQCAWPLSSSVGVSGVYFTPTWHFFLVCLQGSGMQWAFDDTNSMSL